MILGIDVSHFNGRVVWPAVAGSDVRFAYVKATEGRALIDARFAENISGARAAGLIRGAFHYGHPGSSAEAQARHFAQVVGNAQPGDLPPALDLEESDERSPAEVIAWARTFVSTAEDLFGRPLMIYIGQMWRHFLGDPIVAELATRPLWTARYGLEMPHVPRNWIAWTIWQFTDGVDGDVRQVPGVSGRVDCDWFAGELGDLRALAGLPRTP